MGWKSTVTITREEAYKLIMDRLGSAWLFSNAELADMITILGYGERTDLPYYGRNFLVVNEKTTDNE